MTFTWQTNRTPSTRRERLEMDLSLAMDTLAWSAVPNAANGGVSDGVREVDSGGAG